MYSSPRYSAFPVVFMKADLTKIVLGLATLSMGRESTPSFIGFQDDVRGFESVAEAFKYVWLYSPHKPMYHKQKVCLFAVMPFFHPFSAGARQLGALLSWRHGPPHLRRQPIDQSMVVPSSMVRTEA